MERLLNEQFGFSRFMPGQRRVIELALAGQSCAAIFPTGSGKSLCYQLPALRLPNLTLVVSPLLALIQDQLDFLVAKGVAAARIDSTLDRDEERKVMEEARSGRCKILMISVERFKNERFRRFLSGVPISLMAIDEAHCISEWGHNFRPDYLKLPTYQREFNIPQVMLLTATATPLVIDDMCGKFNFPRANAVVTGFYRSNLNLTVEAVDEKKKLQRLHELLGDDPELPTIVYVTLQKTTEKVVEFLAEKGIRAVAYHAGMKNDIRQQVQDSFMGGRESVIVATIAFGMGIDKRDIRRVIHFDLPKSIENYSQEIGRAGRDGLESRCVVLANLDNVNVLENFIYGDTPEEAGIRDLLSTIPQRHGRFEIQLYDLSARTNIRMLTLKTALVYLEMMGIVKPLHSYFAEYRYVNIAADEEIAADFSGERREFLEAVFKFSKKGSKWTSVNFNAIQERYGKGDRQRVVAALEYLDQKGKIALSARQTVEVYRVVNPDFDLEAVARELHALFARKEKTEIERIQRMLAFFSGEECLSRSLAGYFGETLPQKRCEHCSVCARGPAMIRETLTPPPLDSVDVTPYLQTLLEVPVSPDLFTRFLCGITTPFLTKIKAKSLPGFGVFQRHRYQQVREYAEQTLQASLGPSV